MANSIAEKKLKKLKFKQSQVYCPFIQDQCRRDCLLYVKGVIHEDGNVTSPFCKHPANDLTSDFYEAI